MSELLTISPLTLETYSQSSHSKKPKTLNPAQQLEETSASPQAQNPLFPQVKAKNELPETPSTPDFNTNSFSSSKKNVSKPTLPRPEPLYNLNKRKNFTPDQSEKIFGSFMNMQGAIYAKLVDSIYDTRMVGQAHQMGTLEAVHKNQKKTQMEQFELLKETLKNAKSQETWSMVSDLIKYFGAGIGLVAAVGFSAAGGGNLNAALMAGGSALSMGSLYMSKHDKDYDKILTWGMTILGSCMSGYGMTKGLSLIASELPQTLSTVQTTAFNFMNFLTERKGIQAKADGMGIKAKANDLKFKQDNDTNTLQKMIGGFKFNELSTMASGAADAQKMRNEVISRIQERRATV